MQHQAAPLLLVLLAWPLCADAHFGADRNATLWTCEQLTPGLCDLKVTAGSLHVRGLRLNYWLYGEPGGSTPIVFAHGGPGLSHDYLLPLKQQACRGRQLLFYDQVGAGISERPAEAKKSAPWLLTLEYYAEEIAALLAHVGFKEYHFVGNSWGTVVGQVFALTQPAGLKSMVLSGPLSDSQLYIRSQWDGKDGSIGSLPPFIKERIRHLDSTHEYDSPEYKALDGTLTSFFTVRTYPPPDCMARSSSLVNSEIYVGMQGPSEFTMSGVMADMNFTGRLHEVQVPVLLTSGKYDTMRPRCVEALLHALPHAEWRIFPHSGHVSMIDDPGEMNDAIAEFHARVERGGAAGLEAVRRRLRAAAPEESLLALAGGRGGTAAACAACALAGLLAGHALGRRSRGGGACLEPALG